MTAGFRGIAVVAALFLPAFRGCSRLRRRDDPPRPGPPFSVTHDTPFRRARGMIFAVDLAVSATSETTISRHSFA
jgi:hypothetical protein